MKVFFVASMLLVSVSSFASEKENPVEADKEKTSIEHVEIENNQINSAVRR